MTWQCIAEGATGLIYFKWGDLFTNGPETTAEGRMADLAYVLVEVNAFLPFLLSDEQSQEVNGTTDAVRARLFTKDGKRRMLVVNVTREQQKARLSAPGFAVREIDLNPLEVLFALAATDGL